MRLEYYKVSPSVPDIFYGSENAACFDISVYLGGDPDIRCWRYRPELNNDQECSTPVKIDGFKRKYIMVLPGDRILIPTGIHFHIQPGYSIRLHPRSGLAIKQGISLANCEGVIDADYYHQTFIPIVNHSSASIKIQDGMRIAQGEISRVEQIQFFVSNDMPQKTTNRSGGLGSTGA